MWFALLIIPGIVLLLFSYPVHGATKKKHFLSIMTQFRDEVSSVLEFAQVRSGDVRFYLIIKITISSLKLFSLNTGIRDFDAEEVKSSTPFLSFLW